MRSIRQTDCGLFNHLLFLLSDPNFIYRRRNFAPISLNFMTASMADHHVYFRDICSPIVSVPFRSRLRSADNDDMIVPRILGPRVMVRAVSASRHLRFGTRCHLISRTVMLVANSSSRALRLGSFCKPTHKRRL